MSALLRSSFDVNPAEAGWCFHSSDGTAPVEPWQPGRIVVQTGCWESPAFPVVPFEYISVRLESRSRQGGMWGALFYDEQGNLLQSDHYSGVRPDGDWTRQQFCFRGRAGARAARLCFRTFDGQRLEVRSVCAEPIRRDAVAEWAEGLWWTLPNLDSLPAPASSAELPRTAHHLRAGGSLRAVMLGDSIVNDIGNSPWDVLLEQRRPGARVEVMTSVRGSTSCAFYALDDNVERYVLDYRPDLLIIGGASHKLELDPWRDVIRQVRATSETDIALMFNGRLNIEKSGDGGRDCLEPAPDWVRFREDLCALAAEEQVAFFDYDSAWRDFLRRSPHAPAFYLRDVLHTNLWGRQVAARILARYFSIPS